MTATLPLGDPVMLKESEKPPPETLSPSGYKRLIPRHVVVIAPSETPIAILDGSNSTNDANEFEALDSDAASIMVRTAE